ncbi:MAG: hypothetical protein HAW67_08380 [Endozoicomonadaceae bacterium]|nr:hypothetical protein [Endozoicomonadaceae bacterium]
MNTIRDENISEALKKEILNLPIDLFLHGTKTIDPILFYLPVFLMKQYITSYCDIDKLNKEKSIHILIAGANGLDATDGGLFYQLLPLLIPELSAKNLFFI